jgi:hypothetical protein
MTVGQQVDTTANPEQLLKLQDGADAWMRKICA